VIDTTSAASLDHRQQANPPEPAELLRLGCDPLHRHLLAPAPSVVTAWHPSEHWGALLRQGALDAALISVAGMIAEPGQADEQSTPPSRSAPVAGLDPALSGTDLLALPLGRRPLLLLHANERRDAIEPEPDRRASRPWQLLLPAARYQPRLWRQLERLGLLPLQECSAGDSERWLQALAEGPHLLPAHLSLLLEAPWRDAGLRAVPPPEPLEEQLWLLMRQGEERQAAMAALQQHLHERLGAASSLMAEESG